MRPLFLLFLLLPGLSLAGTPAPYDFDAVNAHFAANFNEQPEAMNAEIAKAFKGAAGFGFNRMPAISRPSGTFEIAGRAYRIQQIQLIGIVDRDKPQLYRSFGVPQKARLKQAQGRPLAAFEADAVAALAAGKNLHLAETAQHAAFGAFRAEQSCLRCHEGKIGDLFGAFKYTIIPVPALLTPPPATPKPQPAKPTIKSLLSRAALSGSGKIAHVNTYWRTSRRS